ncbi:TPA: hypothetical protein DCY43_02660 [candidate division WWE3 bacterium]|uniref:Class I SAM-dependent methyltransferase n=3 Tax=Katanobacteria TaxID=422282 RepID=A0A351JTK7_UNCKA|nr:hypothetical protein [candidate division WWE3 bacterium]
MEKRCKHADCSDLPINTVAAHYTHSCVKRHHQYVSVSRVWDSDCYQSSGKLPQRKVENVALMQCPVCLKNTWKNRGTQLIECASCKFVRAKDDYFLANFDEVYSDKYYQRGDYFNYEEEEKALKKNFTDRLHKISAYVASGNLLDVGCGYGYFLELARTRYKAAGVERNHQTAEKVAKRLDLEIFGGDFLEYTGPKKFDIITAFDVIEHVLNPKEFVAKCNTLTQTNGLLIIETGDIESVLARVQRDKWRLINPPEHLNYFSRKTLAALLASTSYEVLFVQRVPFWRTLRQIVFRSIKRDAGFISKLPNLLIPLNTYDLIFVGAKKCKSV